MPITKTEPDELDRDLLLRQSRLLYPDVEDWVLNMSIEAYIKSLGKEEEPEPEALKGVNMSKQCDDEVCLACGS
jgi:hypothetical protein